MEKLLDLTHHSCAGMLIYLVSPNKCETVPHGWVLLPPIGETEADVTSCPQCLQHQNCSQPDLPPDQCFSSDILFHKKKLALVKKKQKKKLTFIFQPQNTEHFQFYTKLLYFTLQYQN